MVEVLVKRFAKSFVRSRGILVFSALAFVTTGVTAASSADVKPGSVNVTPVKSAPLKIVTSIEPLALIARDIGGEQVAVTRLLPKNGNPHQFQLKPSARKALLQADLLLWVGPELEATLVKAVAGLPIEKRLAWLENESQSEEEADHHHHSHHHHRSHSPGDDDEGNHEEHDEGHQGMHPWIDVKSVSQYAMALRQQLVARFPASAQVFREREARLQQRLRAVDQNTRKALKESEKLSIVVDHDGYDGFVSHYGITQLGSLRGRGHGSVSAGHLGNLYKLQPMAVVTSVGNDTLASKLAVNKGVPLVVVDLLASEKAYSSFIHYFTEFSQAFTAVQPKK